MCLEDGVRRQEAAGEEASNILGDQLHQVRVGGCYENFRNIFPFRDFREDL